MTTDSAAKLAKVLPRVRELVREKVVPLEPALLAHASVEEEVRKVRAVVAKEGLLSPHLPESEGGLGLSLPDLARLSEEMGRTPLGHYCFNMQAPDVGNMEILMLHGTDAQKER